MRNRDGAVLLKQQMRHRPADMVRSPDDDGKTGNELTRSLNVAELLRKPVAQRGCCGFPVNDECAQRSFPKPLGSDKSPCTSTTFMRDVAPETICTLLIPMCSCFAISR